MRDAHAWGILGASFTPISEKVQMDDKTLQTAVVEELEWAPRVDSSHVRVAVHDGVVQLSGYVGTLAEKKATNRSVWHLRGVVGVRDDIEVRRAAAHHHLDEEIARRARQVLLWDALVPGDKIEVRAQHGVLTLTGTLDLAYQREEAEQRVQHLAGVIHVDNQIAVPPTPSIEADLPSKVRRAFERHSELDASRIVIEVHDGQLKLSGAVPSYAQRRIAENAAWAVPGVNDVADLMRVSL
jgi:osmotically-inducible protein OsmY